MQYWILTTEMPPLSGGGIGTYVQEMSNELTAQGHRVTVIMVRPEANRPPLNVVEGPVRLVEFVPDAWSRERILSGPSGVSQAFSHLFAFLCRALGAPDVLEVQDYGGLAYFTLQRQRVFEPGYPQTPVIVRVHGPRLVIQKHTASPRFELPGYWFTEMERYCLEAADLVLSPSDAMDRALREEGIRAPLHRARNPLRLPTSADPAYDGGLVYFSRVSASKGILETMAALQRRYTAGHRDRLTIVGGDAPYPVVGKSMTEYLSSRYPHLVDEGWVDFRGALPRDEALDLVRRASAVLMPTRFDSFSYATLEAMALHRVVVAGAGAPSDYVTDEVTGLVADPTSPESMDAALSRAIGMSTEERVAMGEAAARTAPEICSPRAAYGELMSALDNLSDRTPCRVFPVIRPREQQPAAVQASSTPGLLSVVVPCYNLGEYVGEAVATAAASSYRPLEILVIDDGSTDPHTREVVAGLTLPEESDATLRVIQRDNVGLATTRNVGADLASGEFLTFLDADDRVTPTYFERTIRVLEGYDNVGFVGSWLHTFGEREGSWVTWNTELPYLLFHNTLNSAGVVLRRDVFLAHGRNDPDLFIGMEDYDSVIGMVEAGWHGVAIPERLFHYRHRPGSMMSGFTRVNKVFMYEHIARCHTALMTEFGVELGGLLNANGPGWAIANPTWSRPVVDPKPASVPGADATGQDRRRRAMATRSRHTPLRKRSQSPRDPR